MERSNVTKWLIEDCHTLVNREGNLNIFKNYKKGSLMIPWEELFIYK